MPGGHGYAQHQSWNHDGAAEFIVKCLAFPVVQVVSRVSYVSCLGHALTMTAPRSLSFGILKHALLHKAFDKTRCPVDAPAASNFFLYLFGGQRALCH